MAVKINGDTVIDNSKNFTGVQFNVSGDIRVGPAPGDPAAYIRTQTIPAGDPNLANEATELILFHSNDPANGSGPDYITLRAPGVRLQTYNNATIADPSNTAGSLNRLIIAPSGIIDVGVDIRSPYYYDTNNTAYYVKPSSTSVLNRISTVRTDNWLYIDANYGHSVVGVYSASVLQGVWAMGDAYKLAANGTSGGTLYGIAWSHPNAGSIGGANNLASHGMLILENGVFKGAWGGGSLRTPGDVRGTIFYDWDNTGYYVDPNGNSYFNQLGLTGLLYTRTNDVAFTSANDATFSVRGNASYGAVMSFHRVGAYAVNFGLDTDNVMKLGGWSASTVKHNWDMGGNYYCTGNITAYYSDERLKDFHGTIPNALDRILQLNGYYFTENQTAKDLGYSNDRMQVGLSAQEVERVFPEIVTNSAIENDQGYKTIWYDKMVPLLIEAIKEQQTIINDQKSQLEEQNTRLSILETQLETLLNKL